MSFETLCCIIRSFPPAIHAKPPHREVSNSTRRDPHPLNRFGSFDMQLSVIGQASKTSSGSNLPLIDSLARRLNRDKGPHMVFLHPLNILGSSVGVCQMGGLGTFLRSSSARVSSNGNGRLLTGSIIILEVWRYERGGNHVDAMIAIDKRQRTSRYLYGQDQRRFITFGNKAHRRAQPLLVLLLVFSRHQQFAVQASIIWDTPLPLMAWSSVERLH